MKRAVFLGFRDDDGTPFTEEMWGLRIGRVIQVLRRSSGNKDYPWETLTGNHCFRSSEIHIIEDAEVNLDDYL